MSKKIKTPESAAVLVNFYYGQYKHHFESGLHSLLWDIFVKKVYDKQVVALYPVNTDEPTTWMVSVVSANIDGFAGTNTIFKAGYDYEDCLPVLRELNEVLLCHDESEADDIVTSSMNAQKQEANELIDAIRDLCHAGQEAIDYADGSGKPILQEAIWKHQRLLPS